MKRKTIVNIIVIALLIVAFAGILWPMTFKFFAKMKISALDNLFKKKG